MLIYLLYYVFVNNLLLESENGRLH